MNVLEKLGFKKRTHVGITISANNFIELVCIDKIAKAVVKYSSDNIQYNNSIREIVDYEEFEDVIERLFDDVGLIPSECSVTLSLPNVYFGITYLDSTSETPYIVENIQADIEDLYIFKRNEPAISYTILDNGITKGQKNIVFSAIQTKVVAKLLEIFDKMDIDLIRIDNSYSSMFKAIQFCDRFNKYMVTDEKTSIVLITPNSCSAFFFVGPIVADVMEEPLAVKSFSSEEVYSTITKLATNSILKNGPKSLVIISETEEVDSEIVAQRLEFAGDVDCVNKNFSNSDQFIEVYGLGSEIDSDIISYMSIEAIGTAASDLDEYPLDINFIPKERIQKNIVEVGPYEVPFHRYLITIIFLGILISATIGFSIDGLCALGMNLKHNANVAMENEIKIFHKTIEDNAYISRVNILPVMTKIVTQNRAVLDAYVSLSMDIPQSVYIQKFVTTQDGGIGILGEAKTSEAVQTFVDNLKAKNKGLMLTKLSVNAQNEEIHAKIRDGYTFEIKTPEKNIDFNINITAPAAQNINQGEQQTDYERDDSLQPPPSPII